jgi:AbrB family looped-hinge helix DNA binding protein
MTIATVSNKGQITLPAAIRKKAGVGSGTRINVEINNGVIELRPVRSILDIEGIFRDAAIGMGDDYHAIREHAMALEAEEIAREGLE